MVIWLSDFWWLMEVPYWFEKYSYFFHNLRHFPALDE